MRFIKYLLIMTSLSLLAGCSMHSDHDYVQQAQQTKPLAMPAGVDLKNRQNYYPLPAKSYVNSNVQQPSLVPPGSNLERFTKNSQTLNNNSAPTTTAHASVPASASTFISNVKWSQSESGEPVLVVLEKQDQAWTNLGKALVATHYQILDRDETMFSYYIIDPKAVANQVTQRTPIYRVYVQKNSDDTSTILLTSEKNRLIKAEVAKQILQSLERHLL